jgi:hypothetical protein
VFADVARAVVVATTGAIEDSAAAAAAVPVVVKVAGANAIRGRGW